MACHTPPLILRGSLFLSSRVPKVCSRVSSWTARQYHSLCMLGLGFVASLAIIWVIRNYGKFKISVAIQIENATTFSDKACCTQAGQAHAAGHGGGMVRWQHFSHFFFTCATSSLHCYSQKRLSPVTSTWEQWVKQQRQTALTDCHAATSIALATE